MRNDVIDTYALPGGVAIKLGNVEMFLSIADARQFQRQLFAAIVAAGRLLSTEEQR